MIKKKKLSREQYEIGVKSGEYMHVLNTETNKINVIKRDGYYPPEQLKKLLNLEVYN